MNVEMARRFATEGFSCLRMDLCGLGDSVTERLADENDSYTRTMFRDIQITLRHAQTEWGVRRCVLMGLCSGAYAAFQSAAQLTDPALIESILINPLTFFWRDGMSLEAGPVEADDQAALLSDCRSAARQMAEAAFGKDTDRVCGCDSLCWHSDLD